MAPVGFLLIYPSVEGINVSKSIVRHDQTGLLWFKNMVHKLKELGLIGV
jgi:hypothetical protein